MYGCTVYFELFSIYMYSVFSGLKKIYTALCKTFSLSLPLSLTCSRHSLESLAVETELRDFIARRLSRGAVYTGSGNVVSVPVK